MVKRQIHLEDKQNLCFLVINSSILKEMKLGNENSMAVLAFSDLSPDHDQEYFSDGISEELLNLLSKIPELKVISRTSSFSYKGKMSPLSK